MILLSPRLILDEPKPIEAKQVAGWLNDPEVVRYSEQRHKKHTKQTQIDYWLSEATIEPNLVRLIYQGPNLIGSISATVDAPNNIANVGILIGDKSLWGRGFGYEAWECFCNYLFYEKKIRKIEAGCMACNDAMFRIFRKFGMTHEGSKTWHFLVNSKPVDMTMYGKFP